MPKTPDNSASQAEVAAYVADLVGNLARLARDHRLDLLSYLLEVAKLEAQQLAEHASPDGGARFN